MHHWRVSGSYVEVCNCDAPCPCRRLGDKPAGRSLYETCDFALSWMIKDGHFGPRPCTVCGSRSRDDGTTPSHPRRVFRRFDRPGMPSCMSTIEPTPNNARRWKPFSWGTSVEPRPTTMRAISLRCTRLSLLYVSNCLIDQPFASALPVGMGCALALWQRRTPRQGRAPPWAGGYDCMREEAHRRACQRLATEGIHPGVTSDERPYGERS